jgi:hypothetical protein
MDRPISQEVIRTVESVRGRAVKLPTMGGGCRSRRSNARSARGRL